MLYATRKRLVNHTEARLSFFYRKKHRDFLSNPVSLRGKRLALVTIIELVFRSQWKLVSGHHRTGYIAGRCGAQLHGRSIWPK
jgi:hypothetical protein